MINCLNFNDFQITLLLNNLLTQAVVPYDENTKDLKRGDQLNICFEGERFTGYLIKVDSVRRTGINKLKNRDILANGFQYRPHFLKWYLDKGITSERTVLAIDFELVKEVLD